RGRHGDHADVGGAALEVFLELRHVAYLDPGNLGADKRRVGVVQAVEVEALGVEATIRSDRLSEAAHADEHHAPAAIESEDEAELLGEALDRVAAALLPEAPEVRQVLAD